MKKSPLGMFIMLTAVGDGSPIRIRTKEIRWWFDAKGGCKVAADDTNSPFVVRESAEEIDRVCRAYPHLTDDEFVGAHIDEWLG